MKDAYEDVAQAVIEVAGRQARNSAPAVERYRVAKLSPLRLDGIDSDERLDEGDDDVEVYGATTGMAIGDVLPVLHENGTYVVQLPGKGGGGNGGTGGDKHYTHTQLVLSATWDVPHGLGKFPSVTAVNSGDNVVIADVHYVDTNNLVLTFGAATSGKAYVN